MCTICGKPILQAYLELHQVHCEKLLAATVTSRADDKPTAIPTKPLQTASSKPKKTKKAGVTQSSKGDSTDDLDAMLAELSLSDSRCSHHSCSKSVNVLGALCQFCRRRYCMAHSVPEVHGCSEPAKQFAKRQLREEVRGGHPARAKTMDPGKRAQLHRKLDKKISTLSKERIGSSTRK